MSDDKEKSLLEMASKKSSKGKHAAESEIGYLNLIESFFDGICIVANGLVIYADNGFYESLGHAANSMIGKPFHDFIAPECQPQLDSILEHVSTSEESLTRIEAGLLNKDGKKIEVELSAASVTHNEKPAILIAFLNITRSKLIEKAFIESEHRLRQIIDLVPHMIFAKDINGRFLLVNRAVSEAYGRSSEELVGKLHRDIHPNQKEVESFLRDDREVIESGKIKFIEEETFIDKDGKMHILQTIKIPYTMADSDVPAMLGVAIDISALKCTEERLRVAHQQLEATLNALPDILFDVDRDGRIYDYRAPYPNLLYAKPEEFLNRTVREVLPQDVAEIIMDTIDQAAKDGQHSGVVYSLETGWGPRWFELSIAAKGDPKSEIARFAALVRDITDRKQAEDMLKQAAGELQEQKKILTEKNIALKQILDHIESERQDYKRKICQDLEHAIRPLLSRLHQKAKGPLKNEMESFDAAFKSILSKELEDFNSRLAKLSPRETEICEMIKKGLSSKEISDKLNLSIVTIHKHREQVRKKLGITNVNINLNTFLRSHDSE